MTTNDLSQCKNCIYHYTYNGKDMCKQVGEDFYLQWKVEDCPYHTTITSATKISDEIYRLKAENAALRERLDNAVELPCKVGDKLYEIIEGEVQGERVENYRIDNMGIWVTVQLKFGTSTILLNEARKIFLTREAAEARLKELGGRR